MSELDAKDLRAALELTLQVACSDDLQAFRIRLVSGLRRLVAYDTLGYNEIDIERKTAPVLITDPAELLSERLEQRFLGLTHQHPLVRRQQAGDLTTRTISDFLTERQYHKLELYQDFYRLLEAEDQIAFGLPGEMMVAIAINRSSRTFTERDRELLELVRPHLAAACRHARDRERARALIASLEQDHRERDVGVIQITPQGEVEYATDLARELLSAYLASMPDHGRPLPQRLRAWLDTPRACNPSTPELLIDTPRGRLRVRELQAAVDGDWRTLILQEHRARPPAVEELLSLGLTGRQAQVLRLLACGKTSRQIAVELGIATATVSKHLEHIYAHLGVNNRAQAIARIYT